ncbi:MAG: 5-oxoprolinase subunit PxpB [Oscillospiraceae bacterium]|nr:5-oxoprolinase subunit PxpB [Oscillospiraceae bacterium]
MGQAKIHFAGDQALLVEFEPEISIAVNMKVRALNYAIEKLSLFGIVELVPTYRSLLIHYNSAVISYRKLKQVVEQQLENLAEVSLPKGIVTEIPVLYEGEYAPDLEEIASLEQKTVEEVIRIHSKSDYFVYMLGFAPGHPYTARFENPFSFKRRATPRVSIPGGSIVVQLDLSDIIPFEQPCGWNIIGTTPVLACDYRKERPFLLQAGQWIRHVPIDRSEFFEIRRQVELGAYTCKTYEKED